MIENGSSGATQELIQTKLVLNVVLVHLAASFPPNITSCCAAHNTASYSSLHHSSSQPCSEYITYCAPRYYSYTFTDLSCTIYSQIHVELGYQHLHYFVVAAVLFRFRGGRRLSSPDRLCSRHGPTRGRRGGTQGPEVTEVSEASCTKAAGPGREHEDA